MERFCSIIKKTIIFNLLFVFSFFLVACDSASTYYEAEEFMNLTGYEKLYYYVTHEGVSEKDLVGENKKLSDAITSSIDDYTESWKYSSGSYSIRYAKLLDAIVLKVVLDKKLTKTTFEIHVTESTEDYAFYSTILYKEENIECSASGTVPLKFSKSKTLEFTQVKGVESKFNTFKVDSHNACAILLLNTDHHLKSFNFGMADLGFEKYA